MNVYVVTSVEDGWDCVVKVIDASKVSMEDLLEEYPEGSGYIIHEKTMMAQIH